MNLKELKQLMQKEKAKIIVIENEKPIMVITPYEEQMSEPQSGPSFAASFAPSTSLRAAEDKSKGELTLDDLPL